MKNLKLILSTLFIITVFTFSQCKKNKNDPQLLPERYSYPTSTGRATINVSDLPTDIYIVRIFNGLNWEEQKIIIQK